MTEPNKYTSKLNGSRVLVIGGSSGIGFGVAEALVENGSSVFISSSSSIRVAEAVQRLQTTYPSVKDRIRGFACNLGSPNTLVSEVENLFAQVGKEGRFDHVVFTAGDRLATGKLEEFTLRDMQQAGMVRFFAPLVVAQHLRTHLKDGPAASFILTTGGVPEHLMKDWSVIQSYLAGIGGMTRGLAVDLAPIRVNAVGLGPIETELWDAAKQSGVYEQLAATFQEKMTTKTIGKVEDVVESYLYLMKDKNVSGSIINSHGGTLLL